jgi:biotin transport system substrate-specific component
VEGLTMTSYTVGADALRRPRVLSDFVAPRVPAAVRAAVLVVAGAGLVGLLAQLSIPLPNTPVPVTGQTFGVLTVGAVLGWQQAAMSMGLYLVAGGLGVPWFAKGGHGFGGASFGYVIGFLVAATVVGLIASRGGDRTVVRTVATMAVGTLIIYAVGVPWLAHQLHVPFTKAWSLGARPFFVGDAIKIGLAAGVLPGAWAVVRKVRGDS